MRHRKALVSLLSVCLLAVFGLVYTFVSGNEPLLGLDLQGGVSVVLAPEGDFDENSLDVAKDIITSRIDALGVAEPEVTRQGDNILVQLPGIEDRDRAIELVGQTAELRFRPVISVLPAGASLSPGDTSTTVAGETSTTVAGETSTTVAGDTSTTVTDSVVTSSTTTPPATGEQGLGLTPGESAAGAQDTTTPSTVSDTVAPASTDTTVAGATDTTVAPTTDSTIDPALLSQLTGSAQCPTEPTSRAEDTPEATVLLPDEDGNLYCLGPATVTGAALEGAGARLQGTVWVVGLDFKGGDQGIDQFNTLAASCFTQTPECPTGQAAVVLDGIVVSAPNIQAASYEADNVVIQGSDVQPFTQGEAEDLSTVLQYGALPVTLVQQEVKSVSATIGRDALDAGIVAGIVGFVLVTLYMLVFYRLLGLLAVVKLFIEGALLWTLIAWLGETQGLALTLAGVTGIIVSIGVSLDSNVVYYEHLREEVRNGRSIRSATEKGFQGAFSTIVKADGVSVIGAVLLYMLAIGPVRGFAFYLGLSTVLDLITSYFYMRPAVSLATGTKLCARRPTWFGLPPETVATPGSTRTAKPARRMIESSEEPTLEFESDTDDAGADATDGRTEPAR
jgi:preprotein translocase subunit SecD